MNNEKDETIYNVPLWEKVMLTIDEAAAYTGVGSRKIRQLTDNERCPFVLWNGSKRLIKRKVPELNLGKAWFVFDGTLLKQTILYGWTSAMQQGTVQLGKIGVQAIANTMGVSVMAAYTIVNRIDDFACLPEQNIAHSMTSFMAQNSGAGKKERVRKGFWGGMKIELVYGMVIFLVCFFFAEPVVRLFVRDTDVVKEGVTYLKLKIGRAHV